jgi:hypothetical protein
MVCFAIASEALRSNPSRLGGESFGCVGELIFVQRFRVGAI